MPKLRHFDHLNTVRFITFCSYRRHQFLSEANVCDVLIEYLCRMRELYSIRIYAYVLMPEHIHLVLHPPDDIKLAPIIGRFKSKTASAILSQDLLIVPPDCIIQKDGHMRTAFWQPRCYDHNCRTPETVLEKITYCHMNPVKRELVAEPGLWRWSSYNWFHGDPDVPIAMDKLEVSS